MRSILTWVCVSLASLAVARAGCVPNKERNKRALTDTNKYSVVATAECGGTNLDVYYVDWEGISSPSQEPDYSLVHNEFVTGPPEIYTDKEALFTYLRKVIERVKETVSEDVEGDNEWHYIFLQYLISEDLFTLGDDYMWQWYIWLGEFFGDKENNPFFFQWDWVRVATGEELGVNWWLILNYLRSDDFFLDYGTGTESYGILAQSRGSSIISFVPRGAMFGGRYPIEVNGGTYSLYSGSNHGYGIDYLHYLIVYWLAQENPDSESIVSPCMLKGDEYKIDIAGRALTVTGNGDYSACSEKIDYYTGLLKGGYDTFIGSGYGAGGSSLPELPGGNEVGEGAGVNPSSGGKGGTIPGGFGTSFGGSSVNFGGKRVPSTGTDTFYVMGDYDLAFRTLGVTDENGKVDLAAFEQKTKEYAAKGYVNILSDNSEVDPRFASKIYQLGVYSPKLFESYGFRPDTANIYTPKLPSGEVAGKFDSEGYKGSGDLRGANGGTGSALGWTTGAMLANIPAREDCSCA